MRKKLKVNVVEAAERRILEAFNNNRYVAMSFSGGKDSICMADITIKTMRKYNIDFDRLHVQFYDEEGIFPDFERTVQEWRQRFIELGAHFYWFCVPIKHYNCVNKLENDESFICWEPGKEHLWIRPKPKHAISRHKLFEPGMSYQSFADRLFKGVPIIVGLRMYESIQRLAVVSKTKPSQKKFVYPIYDWRDNDVWLYIQQNNLTFPETYIHLYKVGVQVNKLRISQFFSIDTIRTIPRILEFQPGLYEAIIKREPNADLVMLYHETEMFRSSRQNQKHKEQHDWKTKFDKEFKRAIKYPQDYPGMKSVRRLVHHTDEYTRQSTWRNIYQVLVAGDPKERRSRAIMGQLRADNKRAGT